VQIYEVQTPSEAETMISLGVDHVGSVLLSQADWKEPLLRQTVDAVKSLGGKSSLIPLFNEEEAVWGALDYYRPDIVHFCEMLQDSEDGKGLQERLCRLQMRIREHFSGIDIMRSIPIPPPGRGNQEAMLAIAERFEQVSDFFLTDTVLPAAGSDTDNAQPVKGFVGITGETCRWDYARALVEFSSIPVILAGGISPENVERGISEVNPAGIDSCTRTNAVDAVGRSVRFRKDPQRVRKLVEAVRSAEAKLKAS
jgi:phosphoribosylanthranilate isomerase